ncbi:MAG TPA: WHG domain-containing protein [Deltaproteobacteria bacterium]|nr:WHG domain-containing protein [Deltaproteobacteria bacterium]
MPAKSKYQAQDVIDAAFQIVRTHGVEKCSARAIAGEMKSSTMPIYSCIKSMKELEEAIVKKAIDLLIQYQIQERTGISVLDMGIGYILFAKNEKQLFRMLFFTEAAQKDMDLSKRMRDYAISVSMDKLDKFSPLDELSYKQKMDILYKMWTFNHGIAVMLNNAIIEDLSEDQIIRILMDTGLYIMTGVRDRDELYKQDVVRELFNRAGLNREHS